MKMTKKKRDAERILARLKSYECWVATTDAATLHAGESVLGSPRDFYVWLMQELVNIRDGATDGGGHWLKLN